MASLVPSPHTSWAEEHGHARGLSAWRLCCLGGWAPDNAGPTQSTRPPGPQSQTQGQPCDICPILRRPGLAPASLTNAEFRRQQQRCGRKPGRSGLTGKEKLERLGVRFCRVQEKVEDMEILINARGAGFAQGFVKLSCHKRPGRPVLAGEVHQSLVALCSALAHIPTFPRPLPHFLDAAWGPWLSPAHPGRHGASTVLPCKDGWGSLRGIGWAGPI